MSTEEATLEINEQFEQMHDLTRDLDRINGLLAKIIPLGWALLVGAFSLGCWVTAIQINQSALDKASGHHTAELIDLALWRERVEASRFTAGDGNKMIETFTAALNNHDKRLQRTEDGIANIEKVLARIEARMDSQGAAAGN